MMHKWCGYINCCNHVCVYTNYKYRHMLRLSEREYIMEFPYTKVAVTSHLLNATSSKEISILNFVSEKNTLLRNPLLSCLYLLINQYDILDLFYNPVFLYGFVLHGLQIEGQERYGRILIHH